MPAGATYEPIATTTLSSTSSSISFSSISSSYTDLRLIFNPINNSSVSTSGLNLRFNSSATGYSQTYIQGNGSTASSNRNTSGAYAYLNDGQLIGTSKQQFIILDIFSYAGSTNKTFLETLASDFNGSGSVIRYVHLWANTAAISSIQLTSSELMAIGTTATLYGIKAA